MLQHDDNVNMMLSWYMKCKTHPANDFISRYSCKPTKPTCNPTIKNHTCDLTKLILKPYWSQNMTKTRSKTNLTLRVWFYSFLNKFRNKPKNELVPNDLKFLCKLHHDKLVYQNKFHNF